MSTLLDLENALLRLDQANFHRLAEAYLYRRDYRHPHSIGIVLGQSKTRTGTPDTLFSEEDGRYVFAEYSTQQARLEAKFATDIAKCLAETETGIPVDCIREIVLCYTGYLDAGAMHRLSQLATEQGGQVRFVAPAELAHAMHTEFPGLAREFLGIEIDTGQVLRPDDFVALSGRSALATPLSTKFHFRKGELDEALKKLEESSVLLISGRPGVGKSRLAVECCRLYAEMHAGTIVRCIVHRGPDLFEDLRTHLAQAANYLILVDDANRISRFDYVLDMQREARVDRTIKIIATVRDYAFEQTVDAAMRFGFPATLSITAFSDDEIRNLVMEEGEVTHYPTVSRIVQLAQGNPRLALMAARVAHSPETIARLADVTTLYDEYFRSIRADLNLALDPRLLVAAGIVAVFRLVDRSNSQQMVMIKRVFGLAPDEFWAAVHQLHDIEAVDLYEGEVVKVADQVLATYLLFLASIRERVLPMRALLDNFFPSYRERLIDALNPMFAAFDHATLRAGIDPDVKAAYQGMLASGKSHTALHLLDVFWFILPTEALQYVASVIAQLPPAGSLVEETVAEEPPFAPTDSEFPNAVGILSHFAWADRALQRAAVQLIAEYACRAPAKASDLSRVLKENYGIVPESLYDGFATQHAVLDVLEEAERSQRSPSGSLLLAYSQELLRTHVQRTGPARNGISILQFDVPDTPHFEKLRRRVWSIISAALEDRALRAEALDVIRFYASSGYNAGKRDIVERDALVLLPLLVKHLNLESYEEISLARRMFEHIRRVGGTLPPDVVAHFSTGITQTADLLLDDWLERHEVGFDEYPRIKAERFDQFTRDATAESIRGVLREALTIRATLSDGHDRWQIDNGVRQLLIAFANSRPDAFREVIFEHLREGNPLEIGPEGLVPSLVQIVGEEQTYATLTTLQFPQSEWWISVLFVVVRPESMSQQWAERLLSHYRSTASSHLPRDLSYLLRYESVSPGILRTVAALLSERVEQGKDESAGQTLSLALWSRSDIGCDLAELFGDDLPLLERMYFAASSTREGVDHDGAIFDLMVTLDPSFIDRWVARSVADQEAFDEARGADSLVPLWRRPDYAEVSRRFVDAAYRESSDQHHYYSPLSPLFILPKEIKDRAAIEERQDEVLGKLIQEYAEDPQFLEFLFEIVGNFSPDRRQRHVATLLRFTSNFDVFRSLRLEPKMQTNWGSWVPVLQRQIEFFESLLPLCDSKDLLNHRQHIEKRVAGLRTQMSTEKRRDFLEDP